MKNLFLFIAHTIDAGFNASQGRPVGTTTNAGFSASQGRPVGTTTNAGFSASQGHPVGTTTNARFNASQGCPVGTTTNAGFNDFQGRPVGTTIDAGFNASQGRPIGTTTDNGGGSSNFEDDPSKMAKHIEQFELPTSWNTDECSLSVNENILSCARKYVGKQIRFDSKPLGVAMCYCYGSILWSRVDNCHTNLVDICINEKVIPAVAYQKVKCHNKDNILQYRHKSGRLYACSVSKSFSTPSELSIEFHVGKVKAKYKNITR